MPRKPNDKLLPYSAYSRELGSSEGAVLVFARNSREAKKVVARNCLGWLVGDYTDIAVRRLREYEDYLYTLADQEKLAKNEPHVIDSPPFCKLCERWGTPLDEEGICEDCREDLVHLYWNCWGEHKKFLGVRKVGKEHYKVFPFSLSDPCAQDIFSRGVYGNMSFAEHIDEHGALVTIEEFNKFANRHFIGYAGWIYKVELQQKFEFYELKVTYYGHGFGQAKVFRSVAPLKIGDLIIQPTFDGTYAIISKSTPFSAKVTLADLQEAVRRLKLASTMKKEEIENG